MYIYKSTVKKKGGGGDRFTKSAEKASYQELALSRSLLPFASSLENYWGSQGYTRPGYGWNMDT